MLKTQRRVTGLVIVGIAIISPGSSLAAENVSKIGCEAYGDAIVASNTGELILEQRLIRYQSLEEYGRHRTGKRGGHRGICTVKNDPPGYRWLPCSKDEDGYVSNVDRRNQKLYEVEEAIANAIQYRGWSGACKVRL